MMQLVRLGSLFLVPWMGAVGVVGAEPTPADVVKDVTAKLSLPAGTMPLALRITESEGVQKWEFIFEDANFKGNHRLVEFQGGRVVDDRAGAIDVAETRPLAPLVAADLGGRILELRGHAEKLAEMAEVECHRVRLLLLRPQADASAHWEVEVVDGSGQLVGRAVFGCPKPRLIASSWGTDPKIVGPARGGIEELGMEGLKALQDLEDGLRRLLQGEGEKKP